MQHHFPLIVGLNMPYDSGSPLSGCFVQLQVGVSTYYSRRESVGTEGMKLYSLWCPIYGLLFLMSVNSLFLVTAEL